MPTVRTPEQKAKRAAAERERRAKRDPEQIAQDRERSRTWREQNPRPRTARVCIRCGGPISNRNKSGICESNADCAAANRLAYNTGRRERTVRTPEQRAAAAARARLRTANETPAQREKRLASGLAWRAKNRAALVDKQRARYEQDRPTHLARMARWRSENIEYARASQRRRVHGIDLDSWFADQWVTQNGCCYLCGSDFGDARPHVDHDHSCCGAKASCKNCRRGLACQRCNQLIGHVDDDPALLRLIADNLERVLAPTRERIAAKPTAGTLF